ncbi:hypothetical protein [Alkalimonas amylolytica]|uniref:DUF4386 domain-containing protein n=1 Tax=Alkalimonas amylolytica TaxID=152573 RepID=A0A1H4FHG5_ALKAM|nr:hypothetical protein [Alkalimonas amylolytica]SEA95932.1 hypothetical protein SAMN04488051_11040 [Alkalimonas amylolytica]
MQATPSAPSNSTVRIGGVAALGMALCYLSMFIIFFGLISVPPGLDTLGRIEFLQQGRLLFAISYSLGYLVFGILLAISLQALQQAMPDKQSALAGLADRFGWIWVTLMMASGMTYLIGLDRLIHLVSIDPVQAQALYHSFWLITHALGGGIELVGGLWVLLLSLAGLKQQWLPKALHLLGLLIGCLGILTVLHTVPYLKDMFGLLQLIWFSWLGVLLLRSKHQVVGDVQ